MQIEIAERFRPFVHLPGVPCILPFSTLSFRIYPAFIEVFDLSFSVPTLIAEIPIKIQGPVNKFTVLQDLENGCLKVYGEAAQGFFRYRIESDLTSPKGFVLISEKMAEVLSDAEDIKKKDLFVPNERRLIERLSFGVTKKADWALVTRRVILAEILPFWLRLGQMVPIKPSHSSGNASFLDSMQDALDQRNTQHLAASMRNLFLAGFEGLLSPTLTDKMHQGFAVPVMLPEPSDSSLVLLTQGMQLIKQMLVSVKQASSETVINILPCLLSELHAGRYCDINLGEIGRLDLEWSKKQARRLVFHSVKEQTLTFNFQKDLKSFRLRSNNSTNAIIKTCNESVDFAAGIYYLDNFKR